MTPLEEHKLWLAEVEAEIKKLKPTQKYYKLQSEYHRMMYKLCLEKESLDKSIEILSK